MLPFGRSLRQLRKEVRTKMAADVAAAAPKPAGPPVDPAPAAAEAAELAPRPQARKLLAGLGMPGDIRGTMKAVQAASGGSSEYTGAAGAEAAAASDEARQRALFGVLWLHAALQG